MVMSLNAADLDECKVSDNATWDRLYRILKSQVSRWVYGSDLPLWRGQEEDIIADIVQEAVIQTFAGCAADSSRKGEVILWNMVEHTGVGIAYNCYRDLVHRDGSFVRAPLHRSTPPERSVVYERVTQLEGEQLDEKFSPILPEVSTHEPAPGRVKQSTGPSHADTPAEARELAMLAVHLDETAPYATVDPLFQKNLRTRLLKILVEHPMTDEGEIQADMPLQTLCSGRMQ